MSGQPLTVRAYCREILESGSLTAKMLPPRAPGGSALNDDQPGPPLFVDEPVRDPSLRPEAGAEKLPPRGSLMSQRQQVTCLRRFAHHELMAVELFAWALLAWPEMPRPLRRGLVATLEDEQRHLRLYLQRLEAHGAELGQAPLSDYLWRHVRAIHRHPDGPAAFLAAMGLTFEQANLDFTLAYREGFRCSGDTESGQVLARVHHDEIGHVRMAWRWLQRLGSGPQPAEQLYERAVPFPLGAARAKGHPFDRVARRRAGLPESFIEHVKRAGGRPPAPSQAAPALLLWANIGADDLSRPLSPVARRAATRVGALWPWLFGHGAVLEGPWPMQSAPWPGVLGPRPRGAAWNWLETMKGGVPWLASEGARWELRQRGSTWCGSAPDPVLGDKGWSAVRARRAGLVPAELEPLLTVLAAEQLRQAGAGERIHEQVRAWPQWTAGRGVLKPRHGSSGRGRTPVEAGAAQPPSGSALERLARNGGAVLEPWLGRSMDLSVQALLAPDGTVQALGTTRQLLTPAGIWLGNSGRINAAGQSVTATPWEEELHQAARQAGAWMARRGYRGPFGVDAFVYRGADGEDVLRPLVEINPRFTTGMVALGVLERAHQAGLTECMTAWAFLIAPAGQGAVSLPADGSLSVLWLGAHGEHRGSALVLARDAAMLEPVVQSLTGAVAGGVAKPPAAART